MRINKVQTTVEKLEYVCDICDMKFDRAHDAGMHYRDQHSYTKRIHNLMPSEIVPDKSKCFWFVPDQDRFNRLIDGQTLITSPCGGVWSGPGWYYFTVIYDGCKQLYNVENITNILVEKEKQLEYLNEDIDYLKGIIHDG